MYKSTTPENAVKIIKSNDRVYLQAAAAVPQTLVKAMTDRHEELRNVEVCQLHTEGDAPYADPKYKDSFHVNSFFLGKNVRHTLKAGNGSFTPIFLSELPLLFKRNIISIDVALIQVSTPDKHGYCSLGVTVAATLAVIANAKHVIAQVNPNMPRTHGAGIIHISELDTFVEVNDPIPEHAPTAPTPEEEKIGDYIAELIEDESTLQMGIGNIPNAVLSNLHHHKRLGIHTEMFSDGILPLVEKGIITGEEKAIKKGKIVTCFAMGSKKLYDFVDDNPMVHFKEASYTNDTKLIRKNPKVTAINSAIEIDLTGQICADTIGKYQYSGVGGQMDFIRGASLSQGGKAIIAMPAMTAKGFSKIVPFLKEGAGVTTTRAHVHYVVTEYGTVDLFGKNLKQRAKALIEVAHPDVRESLSKQAFERFQHLV
jgi:acyl-CoA hydrolase